MNIEKICKKYRIENYTINPDGSIDVDGDVDLYNNDLIELPLRFNKVKGNFDCSGNKLDTLKGCPRWVGGLFSCSNNLLTSLEFSPNYVGYSFYCNGNNLNNNYCDTKIIGYFYTSFEQSGLIINEYNEAINYKEWQKLRKRNLDKIFI